MSDVHDFTESLAERVSEIAGADSPSDVFRALLEGARSAAPRSCVFLVRRGELRGWGSAGHEAAAGARLREMSAPVDAGWPARLADSANPDTETVFGSEAGPTTDFGQRPAHESRGFAVRVTGKTLAVILVEREENEEPWVPGAVALLVRAAQVRLELDLSRRKLRKLSEKVTAAVAPRVAASKDAEPVPTETNAAAEPEAPTTDPVESMDVEEEAAALDDEAARRFARLVATDIRLYNEESVVLGRRNADLSQRLKDQIERGRETFRRRFPELGASGENIFQDALVQVLAGGDPALLAADG
jgi:hypothetical protein